MSTLLAFLYLQGGFGTMISLPNLEKTKLLVVGEVVRLGPEPPSWSGRSAMYQTVEYRVIEVLEGELPGGRVEIRHLVVKNSPFARSDQPGLSPEFFRVGRKLVAGAEKPEEHWVANYLAVWDQETERAVRELIASVGASKK